MEYGVVKQSKKSRARLGVLKTAHGEIETPSFVAVATQAAVKALTAEEAAQAGTQIAIANTFHLHLKPGEKVVAAAGGLHEFMSWPRPLMTDSGGFQVLSLGFGRDLGVGKIVKYFAERDISPLIEKNTQPTGVKITDDGVFFRSPVDGTKLFLDPRESMRIQRALGADIIFAFDECTPPRASRAYIEQAIARTHRWERESREAVRGGAQALFGIVHGSRYEDLRKKSAKAVSAMGFDGFGIGGDLGEGGKGTMARILDWTVPMLDASKPRHLLGVGHLDDIEMIVRGGIDLFDCTVPTHYARRGIAFTSRGRINLAQSKFLKDKNPLDRSCGCAVCGAYRRTYLAHLVRAKEISAMRLITFHNLHFFNAFVAGVREKIRRGVL